MKQEPRKSFLNQIFQEIKIIEWDKERSLKPTSIHHYWKGKCLICGQIKSYTIEDLKRRKTKGCGNCNQILLINKKFNKLTVKQFLGRVGYDSNGHGSIIMRNLFLCQCECGNLIEVDEHKLKTGNTKSCGCLVKETNRQNLEKVLQKQCKDLTGIKNGKLTIERLATPEETINRPKTCRYWKAKCDCGNYHIVGTSDFLRGNVQSCGCLLSKGEMKISQILTDNNISFIKQYSFSDLHGLKNMPYFFDFGILDQNNKLKYLIEYDGRQHVDINFQFTEGDYEKIQIRDYNKNMYCKEHNIPLIRIPYTHFENLSIDDLLLEKTSFLLLD